jgi:GAF domain-containing protein
VVADVTRLPYHLACSSTTRAEIVVPVRDPSGRVRAVLDLDSDLPAAFDQEDVPPLEDICARLTPLYAG